MKRALNKLMFALLAIAGLCIGIVKGQDARTKWLNKMKNRNDDKRVRIASNSHEVLLDEYEIQSFHN